MPPLAHSLYNSFLSSHCSSCFLPLTTPTTSTNFLHFCNNGVCSSSSPLHYSSSEHHLFTLLNSHPSLYPHSDISDLRLALRLLHLFPSNSPSPRLCGFSLVVMLLLLRCTWRIKVSALLLNWQEVGFDAWGVGNYGPRIIVRSIKEIERGEEVTITYTDLLQPTALRQPELLLEYKFLCGCKRCTAVPQAYVDLALQELFCVAIPKDCSKTLDKYNEELAFEKLRDMLDSAIAEYMEDGNPVSCCEKVEIILSDGLLDQHNLLVKLSPLHSLSLNAYTTLISTYRIRAGLVNDEMQLLSVDMSRISAAYSLLLAGATDHFFLSEPSLIASAATFWVDAGQSLLHYGRSPSWNSFAKAELQNLSAIIHVNCPKCSLMERFKSAVSSSQPQDKALYDISNEFHRCVSAITPRIWSFLIQGCKYLKIVKDPFDFSWIQAVRTPYNIMSIHDDFPLFHGNENGVLVQCASGNEVFGVRTDILRLGVHCLLYGGYLSCICYGHSCSHRLVEDVIHIE